MLFCEGESGPTQELERLEEPGLAEEEMGYILGPNIKGRCT